MSYARGYSQNGTKYLTNVTKPQICNLQFTVNAADTGGLGITSLKSNGYVESVFMHTTATPGVAGGFTNPNPAVGYAQIVFRNNFNTYLNFVASQIAPLVSTTATSVTAGNLYTITSLGTTTLAQWLAAGLRPGFTPAVGQSFVAIETASIGGTGTVGSPGVLAAPMVSVVGTPNAQISNSNISQDAGALVMLQFSAPTSSSVTTPIATAPAAGTIVSLQFIFDGSSVTIDGL